MEGHFLLRLWVHGDHRVSAKRGECRSYTEIGWMGRVTVVERVAWRGRWAVHCTGLRDNFYELLH